MLATISVVRHHYDPRSIRFATRRQNNASSINTGREGAMDRRKVIRLGASAALAAVALHGRRRAFAQQALVLKASDVHPAGYPTVAAVESMGKKLEAATSGRISVQMFA